MEVKVQKPTKQQVLPPFRPPKPSLHNGLETVLKVMRTTFANPSFQTALAKTFVAAGQAPHPVI